MNAPVLRYRNAAIHLTHNGVARTVVRGLDLDVYPEEIVALVGESGSGKTLTALSMLGLLPPTACFEADTAVLNGQSILGLSEKAWQQRRGADAGMVFQEPLSSLNPVLSIGDQIGELLKYKFKMPRRARRERVLELLTEVDIRRPEQVYDDYPHQLSGGMRQRVLLAIALAGKPALLIADEPTTALDNLVQHQVLDLIVRTARRACIGVLFITHDLSVVAQIADRVVVMQNGEAVESGTVSEIFTAPAHAYTRHLIALAPRIPSVVTHAAPVTKPAFETTLPLLAVKNISLSFAPRYALAAGAPAVAALSDVSLSVQAGTTLGIVGESGSGKSTLARVITGLLAPDQGQVWFDGVELSALGLAGSRQHRQQIQMVFQDPYSSLNPRMRLQNIVTEPVLACGQLNGRSIEKIAIELLDAVGLPARLARSYPHELSGGQRQRVGIARALSIRPKLVVCDEPVSALDVSVQAQILALLRELQPAFHLTYLFIAHGLDSVYAVSDQVAVMHQGRVVEVGERDAVFGRPQHPYTRQLLDAMLHADPARSKFPRASPAARSGMPSGLKTDGPPGLPPDQQPPAQAPLSVRQSQSQEDPDALLTAPAAPWFVPSTRGEAPGGLATSRGAG